MTWDFPPVIAALAALAAVSGVFTILFSAAAVFATWRFKRMAPAAIGAGRAPAAIGANKAPMTAGKEHDLPAVTILKPVKGADPSLYESLASFLRQDYPLFQTLFCLQNPDDPALEILRRLSRDFPDTDVDIVISKSRIGYNPKVNNLSNAYPLVKHEVLVISDSDIRVGPDFLRRTVAPLRDARTGMVTCFYRSSPASGLGGALEALSVNGQFLPQAMAAGTLLGLRFAMGAVMVIRRQAFEAVGGFSALSHHIADDFILGQTLQAHGWRIAFSDVVVESVPAITSLREHFAHLTRWSRTIRVCQPWGYAGLAVLQGFPWLSLFLALGPRPWPLIGLWLAVGAARMASVGAIHRLLGRPESQLGWLPLSDLVQFAAWLAGFRSHAVLWRGEYYDISLRGRLVPRRSKPPAMLTAP